MWEAKKKPFNHDSKLSGLGDVMPGEWRCTKGGADVSGEKKIEFCSWIWGWCMLVGRVPA